MKCPCHNCDVRFVGCHSKCDKYKAWKEYRDKIIKEEIKHNLLDAYEHKRKQRLAKFANHKIKNNRNIGKDIKEGRW